MSNLNAFYSSTALWIAAVRAKETERADRLFDDPYASSLAGQRGFEILAVSERSNGGENPYIPVRTRFFDDIVLAQAGSAPQTVLLGAGLDTRAYRLPLSPARRLFELDLPETFAFKESVLASTGAVPRCSRFTVAADLSEDWTRALLDAGFDPAAPCLWIAEGLFFYLSETAAGELLDRAKRLSAPDSLFLADILSTGVLKQPQLAPYLEMLRKNDAPMPFCSARPDLLFERHGWRPDMVTWPGAPDANYGRIPAEANPPGEDSTSGFFLTGKA